MIEKPIEVRSNGNEVRRKGAQIEAVKVSVQAFWVCGIERWDVEVSTTDKVVVADEDSSNCGEKDLVGGEEVDEDCGSREEIPRANGI